MSQTGNPDPARERELIRAAQQENVPASDEMSTVSTPATNGSAPSVTAAPQTPDVDAFPGYELLRELHRGGQGVVYRAIQKATKREVALKILLEGPFASDRARKRFEREIDLVASLHHPNIVTVYDSGVVGGRAFYAMEYIHGKPLDRWVVEHTLREESRGAGGARSSGNAEARSASASRRSGSRSRGSRSSRSGSSTRSARSALHDSLRLFFKICSAIAYAHQHGVIHRDLKPGNILIDADAEPHIVDFGLAKAAGPGLTDGGKPVTLIGEFMGTLAYAAPEQTIGDPSLVDTRTDVYSLGVILYEMLTGQLPYPVVGQMADVLRNIAEAEPARPSTISRRINDEIETIILKALAKEKQRRYPSAEALAADIERCLNGDPIEAKRDSALYVLRKLARRHAYATAVLACVLAILGSASSVAWMFYLNEKDARTAREHLNAQLAAEREFFDKQAKAAMRLGELGWFLLEWENDRLDRARAMLPNTPENTAERIAMEFLLGVGEVAQQPIERIVRKQPDDRAALLYFVAGEKALKDGDTPRAIELYNECIATRQVGWYAEAAGARLRQLAPQQAQPSPAASAPVQPPGG
jgi:hypothetical protein